MLDDVVIQKFAFKLRENDRNSPAIQMTKRLKKLTVNVKHVVFDSWYFAMNLITALRHQDLCWVTKSKKNRLFILNGAGIHAEEMIQSGIKERVAQLPGYGPVKVVVAEINERKRLLVTNDLEMKRKKVIKVYRDQFEIDNPFFRDGKQEMRPADFYTRKLRVPMPVLGSIDRSRGER